MGWPDDPRPAKALTQLLEQLDAEFPDRPRDSDGMIGDQAHAARRSDHNPNSAGVVTALDITTADFTDSFAEVLRTMGRHGDGRIKYVIYKHRITSASHGWAWRLYDGADPHTGHIHLSITATADEYDRDDPWPLDAITPKQPDDQEDDDMTPAQATQLREVRKIAATVDHRVDVLADKVESMDAKLDQLLAAAGKDSE